MIQIHSAGGGVPRSGWVLVSDTWTRTGNHTFTISGDVTATYRKGVKVRYKDGGSYEYGVIASATHAAGTTTVTLLTNTDYTMAAATITDTYISLIENPEGWPGYFNFTLTPTGFSAAPTATLTVWSVIGSFVRIYYIQNASGTSNATSFTFTGLPVAAAHATAPHAAVLYGLNNGANVTTQMRADVSGTTITLHRDINAATWTSSGAKGCYVLDLTYDF